MTTTSSTTTTSTSAGPAPATAARTTGSTPRAQAGAPPGDPLTAATAAHVDAFLNCYLRETRRWRFRDDELVIPLASGNEIVVGVRYRSATLQHRYASPAALIGADGQRSWLSFTACAALLLDQLQVDNSGAASPQVPTALLGRILDSLHDTARYLRKRRDDIERLWSPGPLSFVESEQAQLLGHPLHPSPKSRSDMSPRDRTRYSPETRGRFQLRWVAARPELVRHASATAGRAPALVEALLRDDPATDAAALDAALAPLGPRLVLPAHPWELDHLRSRPLVAELFERGDLVDLGPLASPVTPTTSVRTICQPHWPWQLKFSLHVRVTNSRRVTLPKELDRAVEAATLSQTAVGRTVARVAPDFCCVHDPAYLTVVHEDEVLRGFSVLLRQNRWRAGSSQGTVNVTAVTTLCQDHPFGGPSRLGRIVHRLAEQQARPVGDVGREWFGRFCDVAVVSLVRLYLDVGLCFEAHQQNTLLELDAAGMPERCVYRDSQGYFHREAAHADLCQVVPAVGEASESIFPEELAAERLVYYPFLNLTLGVVNALGAAGCGDEAVLLGDLRRCLESERARGGRYPTTLLDRLLDDDHWPCKGNLRTRLHDMDELVGDIASQSVYVTIPNPLRAGRPIDTGVPHV
jgi:siderophore synthetase component